MAGDKERRGKNFESEVFQIKRVVFLVIIWYNGTQYGN